MVDGVAPFVGAAGIIACWMNRIACVRFDNARHVVDNRNEDRTGRNLHGATGIRLHSANVGIVERSRSEEQGIVEYDLNDARLRTVNETRRPKKMAQRQLATLVQM